MSQKVNPISLRLCYSHAWKSQWFRDKHSNYGYFVHQDLAMAEYIETTFKRNTKNFYIIDYPIVERYTNNILINAGVWSQASKVSTQIQDENINKLSFVSNPESNPESNPVNNPTGKQVESTKSIRTTSSQNNPRKTKTIRLPISKPYTLDKKYKTTSYEDTNNVKIVRTEGEQYFSDLVSEKENIVRRLGKLSSRVFVPSLKKYQRMLNQQK